MKTLPTVPFQKNQKGKTLALCITFAPIVMKTKKIQQKHDMKKNEDQQQQIV